MKKHILSFIFIANFAISTTLADEQLYLKTAISLNYIQQKEVKTVIYGEALKGNITLKRNFALLAAGIGYHFKESWRAETMLDYYPKFTQQETSAISGYKFNININTQITALMFNLYKDFKLNDRLSMFLGGGLGISSIKDDAKGYATGKDGSINRLDSVSGKKVLRSAYKLSTGFSYAINDVITGEVSYNFSDLGKSKPKLVDNIPNITERKFLNHNLTLGMRFSI